MVPDDLQQNMSENRQKHIHKLEQCGGSLVPSPPPQLSSLQCSTINALFVLQVTIAVEEDGVRG